MPLERWQCLLYFSALCDSIVHDVCILIYACMWVIMHFVWWTLMAKRAALSSHECSWPCSMGMRSKQLL